MNSQFHGRRDYLKRLPEEYYRGLAYVHWTMSIQDRRTGWLTPRFHCRFREILTHTMFRYGVCCPIYCCMPDHMHLLWSGIMESANQLTAAKYLRKHINSTLGESGARLQKQPYDHVLQAEERERSGFEDVAEYIARNPERAGIVELERFREYEFSGCLVPGYPELCLWHKDYWERFSRTYSFLRMNGLMRPGEQ